jgi:hypothetical protein
MLTLRQFLAVLLLAASSIHAADPVRVDVDAAPAGW